MISVGHENIAKPTTSHGTSQERYDYIQAYSGTYLLPYGKVEELTRQYTVGNKMHRRMKSVNAGSIEGLTVSST